MPKNKSAPGASRGERVETNAGEDAFSTNSQNEAQGRFKLLHEACADVSVTDAEFRHLFSLLLKFFNVDSGQCNPSDAVLGEAVGKSVRTVGGVTRSLQAKGYCTKTQTRGASRYSFPGVEGRQLSADHNSSDSGSSATSRSKVGNIASDTRQPGCRTEPSKEPSKEPSNDSREEEKKGHSGKGANGSAQPSDQRREAWKRVEAYCTKIHHQLLSNDDLEAAAAAEVAEAGSGHDLLKAAAQKAWRERRRR